MKLRRPTAPSMPGIPRRGFSILEMSVAMAITGIITVSAIGAFATINQRLVSTAAAARTGSAARSLVYDVLGRLQESGGGAMQPWDALVVEPAPAPERGVLSATTEHPRVWYATAIVGAVDCPVRAITDDTIETSAACCLTNYLPLDHGDGVVCPNGMVRESLLLSGTSRQQRQIESATLHVNTGSCTLKTLPGPLAFADVGTNDVLVGGTLSLTFISVLNVDEEHQELLEFRDIDQNGVFTDSEGVRLATRLERIRLRLGWDIDGNAKLTGAEWTDGVLPAGGSRTHLRAAEFGVVVGVDLHDQRIGNTITFHGDAIRTPGAWLESTTSRTTFRNLSVGLR